MTDWTKYLGDNVGLPPASEPMQALRAFQIGEQVIDSERVETQSDGWRVTVKRQGLIASLFGQAQSVRLFEIADSQVQLCLLVYRAKMKPEELSGQAYLEMRCRMNGREFFSKGFGFGQVTSSTPDWETYETPFLLKKGEISDFIKLNVAVKGSGTVLIKDIEVLCAPLQEIG